MSHDDGQPDRTNPRESPPDEREDAEVETDPILKLLTKAEKHLDSAEKNRKAAKQKLATLPTPEEAG